VHPFKAENIKGSSINLSASKFAWKIDDRSRLEIEVNGGKQYLIIPASTPVIFATEEAVYVSSKICGTYHTKVSWASRGLGYVSTTLDPEYFGVSLIGMTNTSANEIKLEVGETFVTLMFGYLHSEASLEKAERANSPHQSDIIARYEDGADLLGELRNLSISKLKENLDNDDAFKSWVLEFAKKDSIFQKQEKAQKKKRDIKKFKWKLLASLMMYLVIAPLLMIFFIFAINWFIGWLEGTEMMYNANIDANDLVVPLSVAIFISLLASFVLILTKAIFPYIDKKWGENNA